ncbi:MAG: hypothetical protein EOO42_02080 [Flavobacteriales bacterium]|nr:MAG: hypothetical protein EOO42_02080 [Flavobacteriales bacterium]
MKTLKFKFLITIACLLLTTQMSAQQQHVKAQQQNIQSFVQVWGLVKYRSTQSIEGKFDADKVFLSLIDSVKNANQAQLNQFLQKMIGPSLAVTTNERSNLNTKQHLLKNIDYSWINNNSYSKKTRQTLSTLANQINKSAKHHYIPAVWYESELPNEPAYADYKFTDERMNLLALAKAWNAIAYLFPYKYMTDKDWTNVLEEMIPVFGKINDRASYEKSVLLLATHINDTHAGEFLESEMKMSNLIFNVRYYPPFDYKATKEGIVVKQFLTDSLAKLNTLKPGDVIISINGIKIDKWYKDRWALLPASNPAVKLRELGLMGNNRGDAFAFSNLESATLHVKVKRNGANLQLKTVMLDRIDKTNVQLIENSITQQRNQAKHIKGMENIGEDIMIFRAGHFFDKNLPKADELAQLSADLKRKKAIIFDMRKYPQSPGLFSYYLPLLLGKAPFAFARYYALDLSDPGSFLHRDALETYMYIDKDATGPIGELYSGKIVILTNEETQSMAEWFTMMLQQFNTNTTVIGSQTAGADGDVKRIILPGKYRFSFTGNGIFYPDGRETQRIGIKPDIYFNPSAVDLAGKTDAQLERALNFINNGK